MGARNGRRSGVRSMVLASARSGCYGSRRGRGRGVVAIGCLERGMERRSGLESAASRR